MYKTFGIALMLTTLAFAGCQESNPSMTIVSLQIDSDEEDTWFYLYSIPRVKMGNLTILVGGVNETLTSVFSHQKHLSKNEINNMSKLKKKFISLGACTRRGQFGGGRQ